VSIVLSPPPVQIAVGPIYFRWDPPRFEPGGGGADSSLAAMLSALLHAYPFFLKHYLGIKEKTERTKTWMGNELHY
jgi:hypothetical protein